MNKSINNNKSKIEKGENCKKQLQNKFLENQKTNNEEKQIKKEIKEQKQIEEKKLRSKKQKIVRTIISLSVLIAIFLAIFLPLYLTGVLKQIESVKDLKELILSYGMWSAVIFAIIQFLQVTVLPIPAAATTVAGALIFGPTVAFFISFLSVMLASIFSFWLGKKVGKKVVYWIVGEDDAEKWSEKLGKGKFAFFLMMLFPIFPDDILCLLVGITNMSYKFFIITNLITRPISLASLCYFGSGHLIPFTGWGIYVWVAIAILALIAFVISIKYQAKLEKMLDVMATKLSIKAKYNKRLKQAKPAKSEEATNNKNNEILNCENLNSEANTTDFNIPQENDNKKNKN